MNLGLAVWIHKLLPEPKNITSVRGATLRLDSLYLKRCRVIKEIDTVDTSLVINVSVIHFSESNIHFFDCI